MIPTSSLLAEQASPSLSVNHWSIAGIELQSRFMLGTARYPSPSALRGAIEASGAQVLTVGVKRDAAARQAGEDPFLDVIRGLVVKGAVRLLPNTAGCFTAREAIALAHMARELYDTTWIKLEVIGDAHTLQPDTHDTVVAAAALVRDGFVVLPYCTADIVVAKRLIDAGCSALMPWGAPIGSGRGLVDVEALQLLRERLPSVTLIVDAGIGAPSHAALAMEIGFDAVLLNSAVAGAGSPADMAGAFRTAIESGRRARLAGIIAARRHAVPSTPVGASDIHR